jgi:hypothetical protein
MRFPRGSLPPSAFDALARQQAPVELETESEPPPPPPPPAPPTTLDTASEPGSAPRRECELASTCPNCGTLMQPEHAHYRCVTCGYRDSCCF